MAGSDENSVQLWGRSKDGIWHFVRVGNRATMAIVAGGFDARGRFAEYRVQDIRKASSEQLEDEIWARAQKLAAADGAAIRPHALRPVADPEAISGRPWDVTANVTNTHNQPYLDRAIRQISEEGWMIG